VILVVITIVYMLVADHAGHPLSMFALPPLLIAIAAGPLEVLLLGAFSVVTAIIASTVDGGPSGTDLTVRLLVVVSAALVAAFLAYVQHRREGELDESLSARRVVDALQSRLVAVPIPPDSVHTVVRYVPGDPRLAVGGDFLDAVTLPDGAVGFVIGDVSGHGARAAAFGVVVRAGWKAIAIEHPDDPCYWLDALERSFFQDGRYDGFATALVGRLAPGDTTIEMCSAGHCWPIVVDADCRLLDTHNAVPLGVHKTLPRTVVKIDLHGGERVLLYTDGLIENRKRPVTAGRWSEAELLEWVRAHPSFGLDDVLAQFGPDGFDDDVALMTIESVTDPTGRPTDESQGASISA
jgi:serine phosphatase RsbU (regulator of sigma subunit)